MKRQGLNAAHRSSRSGRPAGRNRRPDAFTLVELLTIIVILSMLIGLALPSVLEAIKVFRVHQSEGIIEQLAMGIRLYRNDWKDLKPPDGWPSGLSLDLRGFPPSSGAGNDSVTDGLEGGEALVQALLGYKDKSRDGKTGRGSRYVERGRVYGPYVSGELALGGEEENPMFLDGFGNAILYYRAQSTSDSGTFVSTHNTNGPSNLTAYLTDPNNNLYRQDYVLLTPGPDRAWMQSDDKKTDDIANFVFHFEDEDD